MGAGRLREGARRRDAEQNRYGPHVAKLGVLEKSWKSDEALARLLDDDLETGAGDEGGSWWIVLTNGACESTRWA